MKKKYFVPFELLLLFTCMSYGQGKFNKIQKAFFNKNDKSVLVVSHRADWRNAPENSLQAIKNCINMGVDMIEIDLKKTKDGQLILMHDKTIDRTTTGKGFPSDYTLAELRKFRLKNGAGHATAHSIPTLTEVMNLCKGRILVNIDKGYEYFHETVQILEETKTIDQCIVKSELPYEKVIAENRDVLKYMNFMPVIDIDKENSERNIDIYISNLHPLAFELVFKSDSPETLRIIEKIKDSKSKVFVNAMWPELCGGHDDDKAVENKKYDESWGWIINCHANLIQTDRPLELLKYLQKKHLHE